MNAKALEDSQVIKLPMRAFQEVFKEYPDIFVRVIQVIAPFIDYLVQANPKDTSYMFVSDNHGTTSTSYFYSTSSVFGSKC